MTTRRVIVTTTSFLSFLFCFEQCAYNDISVTVDCTTTSLEIALESKQDVSTCKSIDGSITVSATGGTEPYSFNLNGGDLQTDNVFDDLGSGTYTIKVQDKNKCESILEVTINAAGTNLSASATTTPDDQCFSDNGSITVAVTGGKAPYKFQIDSGGYGDSNAFDLLKSGQYVIIVKDAGDCQITLGVQVPRGNTGISYATDIKPILDTNCNKSGCHGAGTGFRDWTDFNKVKTNAANIKTRTANGTMPPGNPLEAEQIAKIACWVDDGALNN